MVDSTDVLLKAAEDVSSGMWCKGAMFRDDEGEWQSFYPDEVVYQTPDLEYLAKTQRCALGSLSLVTMQLGGDQKVFDEAILRVVNQFDDETTAALSVHAFIATPEGALSAYNDRILPNDPVAAGSQLADLFRSAATTV